MQPYRPMRTTRDIQNLQRSLPGWYRIQMKDRVAGQPDITQVTIYDEIGFLGVSADTFMRDLAGVDGDVELHLNSPGGDVHDGITIYNQLKQRKGAVSVVVDGLAASAASFIAQAATPGKLAIAPHAQMMIHLGFGMGIGNAQDMRDYADLLDKASNNIAGIYADRTGKPASYWLERMEAETWYDDHEAVADGLADYVLGQEQPQNKWDLSVYQHAPGIVLNDKYTQAQIDALGAKGHAFKNPDGHYSYPIDDEEDLGNAIRAVGRGGADHDAIRKYVIGRAKALGKSDSVPDNWNADGSLKTSAGNLSKADIRALFARELASSNAGKE